MCISFEILQTVIILSFHNYMIFKIHFYDNIAVANIDRLGPLKKAKTGTDSQPYHLSLSKISKTVFKFFLAQILRKLQILASLTVWGRRKRHLTANICKNR